MFIPTTTHTLHHYDNNKSRVMSVITSEEPSSASSSSGCTSSEEDIENNSNTRPICGDCGKELDTGWHCPACRKHCPVCNRALSNNPNEYCERCFRLCDKHGLYTKIDNIFQCIQCIKQ